MLLAKYCREAAWLKHEQRTRHQKKQLWNKSSPLKLYESQSSHLWNGGCNPCPTFLPKEGTQEVIQGKSPHQVSVAALVMLNQTLKTTAAYSSKHWIRAGVCGVQRICAWLLRFACLPMWLWSAAGHSWMALLIWMGWAHSYCWELASYCRSRMALGPLGCLASVPEACSSKGDGRGQR